MIETISDGFKPKIIAKVLSRNDTGETGGHQAGILIPKDPQILSFFSALNPAVKNPRALLNFRDPLGRHWGFTFIYYNNRRFGGTRNEYRLTGMTAFVKNFNLKAGDKLIFKRIDNISYGIEYEREAAEQSETLKLGDSWKIISI